MHFRYKLLLFLLFFTTLLSAQNLREKRLLKIDSLKKVLEQPNLTYDERKNHLNSLIEISIVDKQEEALNYAKTLIEITTEAKDDPGKINAHTTLGMIYYFLDDFEKSLEYYLKALQIAGKDMNDYEKASLYIDIKSVFVRILNYKQAERYISKALEIYLENNDEKKIAEMYFEYGILYKLEKKYGKAIAHFNKSLEINTQILKELNEEENSELFASRISKLKQRIGRNYSKLGKVHLDKKEYDIAEEYFKKSLKIHTNLKEYNLLGLDYNDIGYVYRMKGDLNKAISYNKMSYEYRLRYGRAEPISSSLRNVAVLYLEIGDYDLALEYLKKADDVLKKLETMESKWYKEHVAYNFYQVYEKIGKYELALNYYKEYSIYKDEIRKNRNAERKRKFEMQFEVINYENELSAQDIMIKRKDLTKNVFIVFSIMLTAIGILLFFLYLSNRKVNLELSAFNNRLEDEVQLRTKNLEEANKSLELEMEERHQMSEKNQRLEQELRQSQKMEAIGTLAGGIAHDFNNILSIILGYAQYIQRDLDQASKLQPMVGEIIVAGKRAKSLIEQILTFSRRSTPEKKSFAVKPIVEESLKMLRASIPSTIEIKQNLLSENITVIDETQLQQIIMNLIMNASQAINNNGKITVSLTDVSAYDISEAVLPERVSSQYLCLEISDDGHGIPKDTLERIFEPYFTTKIQGDGTGMGLAIVHGIIQNYKGAIDVESTLGKGSTFKVYLPIYQLHNLSKDGKFATLDEFKPLNIVVVDDESAIVALSERAFNKLGYNVKGFINSKNALKYIERNVDKVDVIITDQTMPELTGTELIEKVWKKKSSILMILCTGFLDANIPDHFKKISNFKLMFKPTEVTAISGQIQDLYKKLNT